MFMVKQTMKKTTPKIRYKFAVYNLLCLKLDYGEWNASK